MSDETLRFRGGLALAFLPVAVFLGFCILYFVVFKAFDMTALAMGGFVALLIGAVFAKKYGLFWEHVMKGIGSPTSVSIVVILFLVGMVSDMIKATNVSGGFVWLADSVGLTAGFFPFFAFLSVSVVSMATGSSIGTFFTAFPIFYAAGIAVGADPALLAGAILSGGILGDNLAPISDTTIISSSSQRFRSKGGFADVGGVVKQRARFALTAAGFSALLFLVLGMSTARSNAADESLLNGSNPLPL
ncbi:Na+/H+ antiporter NhaC family protein [Leucobacter coleopterorum]|uniref:Na+/H+ antiporter NhaC family protein n=1 Tax=Leucobacter coleopterorum TaxID=2714933 RepID=UPI001980A7A1|nr:Na+/H+ antiporter NhaC family protein [Leucobacter coleopterorum]